MTEQQWDRKLRINTSGRVDAHEDVYHYPYEPTPYSVLEKLVESGFLTGDSVVVDYGCGKGRVGFFLNYRLGCQTIGVEFDEEIYKAALRNSESCIKSKGVEFVHTGAEKFQVTDADSFYFFNPFSVEILQSVLGRILDSYYESPRHMLFFFYYPNEEYISFLMTRPELMFVDEIDCMDLFQGNNKREKILIFELS